MTPPVYGSWQAARATVPADAEPPRWLRELNLDPSARAVAGLGVASSRSARSSSSRRPGSSSATRTPSRGSSGGSRSRVAVLGSVVRRRVEPMDPGRLVQFLGPAHARLRTSPQTLARRARDAGPAAVVQLAARSGARCGPAGTARAPPRRRRRRSSAIATRLGQRRCPASGPSGGAPGLVTGPQIGST